MNNLGSFGAAAGGLSPELQAAMSARGPMGGAPAPAQTTMTAPTNQAPTTSSPSAPPAAMGGSVQGSQPQFPFDSSEAKMILGAMGSRLKAISKLSGA